jgi:hypothetical protein
MLAMEIHCIVEVINGTGLNDRQWQIHAQSRLHHGADSLPNLGIHETWVMGICMV